MARTTLAKKAWRSLAWLGVIIVGLVALNAYGVFTAGAGWAPKLALDLEGGTEIILAPQLASGKTVTADELNQAVAIIRQRVDASGVTEAEINTQGNQNIVVSIPGIPDQQTLNRIQSSAKLEFRPVLQTEAATTSTVGSASPTPSPTPTLASVPSVSPTNASDTNWITPALQNEYDTLNCAQLDAQGSGANVAPEDKPLVTCQSDGSVKYILGPVEVSGTTVSDATSGLITTTQGANTGTWAVNIVFNSTGTDEFAKVTARLFAFGTSDVRNRFAIVLDGKVIEAPSTQAVIADGKPQITGSFDQASASTLADQLKFGALPLSFRVDSKDTITATLGTTQLLSGLLAGLIGLILVVAYSVVQYRSLAAVTISSLVIAATITYFLVTLLSWRQGYRLSLAGVAGLIVAIGITADSFIVYFERIRDELRDGRSLPSAVEAGWTRAIRTILASDAVNFLAAATLFLLAVGNVRGFALTLGLTTIVDVVVVTLFTHPVLRLISTTNFFGQGHPLSGLDPQALGAVYRGRAQFRARVIEQGKTAASTREAVKRQTIAERKAAEAEAKASATSKPKTKGKDS